MTPASSCSTAVFLSRASSSSCGRLLASGSTNYIPLYTYCSIGSLIWFSSLPTYFCSCDEWKIRSASVNSILPVFSTTRKIRRTLLAKNKKSALCLSAVLLSQTEVLFHRQSPPTRNLATTTPHRTVRHPPVQRSKLRFSMHVICLYCSRADLEELGVAF